MGCSQPPSQLSVDPEEDNFDTYNAAVLITKNGFFLHLIAWLSFVINPFPVFVLFFHILRAGCLLIVAISKRQRSS